MGPPESRLHIIYRHIFTLLLLYTTVYLPGIYKALYLPSKTVVIHFPMTPALFMGVESCINSCTSLRSVRSASACFDTERKGEAQI